MNRQQAANTNMSVSSTHVKSTEKGRKRRNSTKKHGAAASLEGESSAPIFLRKTYHMIDSCDPKIATWSKDGLSFVVKDTDKFATEVIVQFFKHNKFASFVRQLNFYGFRKVKSDPIRIADLPVGEESKYWVFRHPKFQRGRADLLAEIKKTNHQQPTTETADKNEVEALKKEVAELKENLANMSGVVFKLTALVENLTKRKDMDDEFYRYDDEPTKKKRRVSAILPDEAKSAAIDKGHSLSPIPYSPAASPADTALPPPPAKGSPRQESSASMMSLASFTTSDEEFLASLFTSDAAEEEDPPVSCKLEADLPDLPLSLETHASSA